MPDTFIVREGENGKEYSKSLLLDDPSSLKLINHEVRIKILELLSKKPMYAAEVARELKMHEQKVYYHIKQLINAGVLDVVEREEIRGTVAKKYAPNSLNFTVSLGGEWNPLSQINKPDMDSKLSSFLEGFMDNNQMNFRFVVGSPDPHGEFKAYSRDGHYAVDLSLFIGNLAKLSDKFSVMLDVDVKKEKEQGNNLILVGGPVTNTIVAEVNDLLPIKFSDSRPWGIKSTRTSKEYTDDTIGLIAKIPNPFNDKNSIIVLAGIRFIGTKAAVLALTRHYKQLLKTYTGQRSWAAIVQGFDMDGDGKIDNIEILE